MHDPRRSSQNRMRALVAGAAAGLASAAAAWGWNRACEPALAERTRRRLDRAPAIGRARRKEA